MRGRIAYASGEPLLLTFDGELLLAFDATTLAPKWNLAFAEPLAAIVFASSAALPRVHAGNPWRSSVSGHDALVVDRKGGIHAIDVASGRVLGTLAAVGAPVAVAAGDSLAIALADHVLLWHDAQRYEVPLRATALAFSRDGLTLAAGNAKGEVREITLATRAVSEPRVVRGIITAIAPRRAGEWVVATDAGVHHLTAERVRRLREGGASSVVCDTKGATLALQLAVDRVLVCEWPASPITRIEMVGRTITDLALSGDRLVLAVHGGDANLVSLSRRTHLATKEHAGRTSREWKLRVEAEKDAKTRWEGTANRLGLGAFFTLVVVLLCMGYLSSTTRQNWVPPPAFLVTESCNDDCELERVQALRTACDQASEIACGSDAEEAYAALETRDCDDARLALGRVRHRLGARDDGGHAQLGAKLLAAEQGLERGCLPPPADRKRVAVVELEGEELSPKIDASPFVGVDPRAILAMESGVVIATISNGRCAIRQKTVDGWHTRVEQLGCHAATLTARAGGRMYASLGSAVWSSTDGSHWQSLPFPGPADVQSMRTTPLDLLVMDEAGRVFSFREGSAWVKEKPSSDMAPSSGETWEAPDHTIFGTSWASIVQDDGVEKKSTIVPLVVDRVWGRTSKDVYAGGPSGLVHFDGDSWKATSFRSRVRGISGTSRSVWVIADKP